MTYDEAKKQIRKLKSLSKPTAEAVDIATEALEKQIPKKPHLEGDGYWACPTCDEKYEFYNELDCLKWCSACGQAIDWSEE